MSAITVGVLGCFLFAFTTYQAIREDEPEAAMTQMIGFGFAAWFLAWAMGR